MRLDRRKISEDVGMIEFKIVQYRSSWAIVDELGALVAKRRIVLVGLDHKKGRIGLFAVQAC